MLRCLLLAACGAAVAGQACGAAGTAPAASLTVSGWCGGAAFVSEEALLGSECLSSEMVPADAVCAAMNMRWWAAAKALLPRLASDGRPAVRSHVQAVKDGSAGLIGLVRRGGSDAGLLVRPAVSWAQSHEAVHVRVRFSPKKHGPVSASKIESPEVRVGAAAIGFSAHARSVNSGKRLDFRLELPLNASIDEESSTHALAPGRLTFRLAKAEPGQRWKALAASPGEGEAIEYGHVGAWFEEQERLDGEAKKRKAAREKSEAKAKEAAEAKGGEGEKPAPASPTPPSSRKEKKKRAKAAGAGAG